MTWSTRQLAELAELAGTSLKAVRHHHEVVLLEEPERAANGYKRYRVVHLIRLLRIRRLVDLGVPLSRIAATGRSDLDPEVALRLIDAELASSIQRLKEAMAELAMILRQQSASDHPAEPRQTPTTRAELERAWRSTVPGSGPQGARWARIVSVSLVAFTALAGVLTTAFQYGLPWWTGDRDSNHSFTSSEGTIRYQVHVPPTHGDDVRYPVMMAIHGCGMTDPGGTR